MAKTWNATRRKDTPENRAKAKQLRDAGMCWEHIAREIGMANGAAIKRWLDDEYLEFSRWRTRQWQRKNKVVTHLRPDRYRPTEADLEARWREIPPDTRTLTGRLCGDPLPGRDALSRRAQ